jgi:hypothetical protein
MNLLENQSVRSCGPIGLIGPRGFLRPVEIETIFYESFKSSILIGPIRPTLVFPSIYYFLDWTLIGPGLIRDWARVVFGSVTLRLAAAGEV